MDSDSPDRWWNGCRVCGTTTDGPWLVDDDPWSAVHVSCVEKVLGTLGAATEEAVRVNRRARETPGASYDDVERARAKLQSAIDETRSELELAEMLLDKWGRP